MSRTKRSMETWRSYWSRETRPRHGQDTAEFYANLALEIRPLIEPLQPHHRVLDLGCGDGALHTYLGFDRVNYRGVDFSPSMLALFREKHPGADLVEGDAITYAEGGPYDLVFSCGLIQYFSRKDLGRHLDHIRPALADGARVVHSAVPWRLHRQLYRWGWALGSRPQNRWGPRRLLRPILALWRESMGHWWGTFELDRVARRHGYVARLHGSGQYIYRCHVVFTPKGMRS